MRSDLGNGKLGARATSTPARTRRSAVLPGSLVPGIVRTSDAAGKFLSAVTPGIISAQIAWVFAVLTELNAYPGPLNVGSRAARDRPSVLTGAVTQDTLAMVQMDSV